MARQHGSAKPRRDEDHEDRSYQSLAETLAPSAGKPVHDDADFASRVWPIGSGTLRFTTFQSMAAAGVDDCRIPVPTTTHELNHKGDLHESSW